MTDIRHLAEALSAYCDQQERRAHADFTYHLNPLARGVFPNEDLRPWRAIMPNSLVSVINILEEMDLYEGPILPVQAKPCPEM